MDFVSLLCSETLWIPFSYSKQMSSTTSHNFFFSEGNKNFKKTLYFEFLKVTYISSSCPAHHQIFKHLFPQTKTKSWAGDACKICVRRSELDKAWFTFCLEKSEKKFLWKIKVCPFVKNQGMEFKYREGITGSAQDSLLSGNTHIVFSIFGLKPTEVTQRVSTYVLVLLHKRKLKKNLRK